MAGYESMHAHYGLSGFPGAVIQQRASGRLSWSFAMPAAVPSRAGFHGIFNVASLRMQMLVIRSILRSSLKKENQEDADRPSSVCGDFDAF